VSKALEQQNPKDLKKAAKTLGPQELSVIFPARVAGDLVTQPLTMKPEEEQFASHFNRKKVESGRSRVIQQVLNNVRSAIGEHAGSRLGAVKKYILLEKSS